MLTFECNVSRDNSRAVTVWRTKIRYIQVTFLCLNCLKDDNMVTQIAALSLGGCDLKVSYYMCIYKTFYWKSHGTKNCKGWFLDRKARRWNCLEYIFKFAKEIRLKRLSTREKIFAQYFWEMTVDWCLHHDEMTWTECMQRNTKHTHTHTRTQNGTFQRQGHAHLWMCGKMTECCLLFWATAPKSCLRMARNNQKCEKEKGKQFPLSFFLSSTVITFPLVLGLGEGDSNNRMTRSTWPWRFRPEMSFTNVHSRQFVVFLYLAVVRVDFTLFFALSAINSLLERKLPKILKLTNTTWTLRNSSWKSLSLLSFAAMHRNVLVAGNRKVQVLQCLISSLPVVLATCTVPLIFSLQTRSRNQFLWFVNRLWLFLKSVRKKEERIKFWLSHVQTANAGNCTAGYELRPELIFFF